VRVDGQIVTTPATRVVRTQQIKVEETPIRRSVGVPKVWLHNKMPKVLVTRAKDPEGRATLFSCLEKLGLPHLISVGR
jgi:23S rRNA pseudouridine2605 synthase